MQESFLVINFDRPGNLELAGGEAACMAHIIFIWQPARQSPSHFLLCHSQDDILAKAKRPVTLAVLGCIWKAGRPAQRAPPTKGKRENKATIPVCLMNRGKVLEGGAWPIPLIPREGAKGHGWAREIGGRLLIQGSSNRELRTQAMARSRPTTGWLSEPEQAA